MSYKMLSLSELVINRANDRHGELENETAAIAWLFSNHEAQMRNLTKDIVSTEQIYEPPLVYKQNEKYIVFDGNRRVTCLKLLTDPKRAPDSSLQKFFREQKAQLASPLPSKIRCQVETDRDRIDEILYRRHTGSQNGVGQSNWDGRMKATFVNRTGKGGRLNVADEIERVLSDAGMLPDSGSIPRSNLNRLLSAEAFRNRVGISATKGKFQFIRKEEPTLKALARVADDLARKKITLDDVWDVDRKSAYLDDLENEGILPSAKDAVDQRNRKPSRKSPVKPKGKKGAGRSRRTTLIPDLDYGVAWAGRLQRHRAIWEELQFALELDHHPNAISVMCRVLLELSVDNYIARAELMNVSAGDKLSKKLIACAEHLHTAGKIDKKYLQQLRKAQNMDDIVSIDTLNRYVHSPNFAPSPEHLAAIWDTLADLVVLCLNE